MARASSDSDISFQLTAPTNLFDRAERIGMAIVGLSVLALIVAAFGAGSTHPTFFLLAGVGGLTLGGLVYFQRYLRGPAGIDNDGLWFSSTTAKGAVGWVLGIVFTGFYVLLYWFPSTLEHLIRMCDPLAQVLRGGPADQWFLYGLFYTLAVVVMGVRAAIKYRHSTYQLVRTASVSFFQLGFAFLIPQLLIKLNQPEFYFHYFWPLEHSYLFPSTVDFFTDQGKVGVFMVFWGAIMTFVAVPVLTYFFGKRWYCSWVCGCGGLAETAGDPFRHLSDNSLGAWRAERWLIHGILVAITLGTGLLWINSATGGGVLGSLSGTFASWYGFAIGAVFSGVIGVGFYPIMGSRVWCRFGCPLAAILGILQKYFSRFRITTNGGQCISCGNCSTYCEMGIDVKWYAQRGQNIVRAACVGCGVCSEVCPRGVLKLENGPRESQYRGPLLLDGTHVSVAAEKIDGAEPPSEPSQQDIPVMSDEDWEAMGATPRSGGSDSR